MKIIGVVLIVAALVTAIAPPLLDCESNGRALTLQNGMQVPMKCHWTGQAAQGMALPLFAVGALVLVNKRREVIRNLGIVGMGLGALAILLPTALIGVCANPDMICNSTMRPLLILTGTIVGLASAAAVFLPVRAPRAVAITA
jgi:hypothetical protein